MLDFVVICTRNPKKGVLEVYPKFKMKNSSDLMIRGGDFYAIWLEEESRWSTDEQDVIKMIDAELDKYVEENNLRNLESAVHIKYMWDSDSGIIDKWHKYVQRQMRDNFHMLDEKIIFQNDKPKKEDYSSKHLDYPLEKGSTDAFDKLTSVLYSPEELDKILWAIGSVVSGDSKSLQKFVVLYGAAGTGKSTVLNIIQDLFKGYYSVFDARALGSSSNSFALEAFKSNPLVSIQHDGDLSRIEDNTRLNSLVSHELMTVNEKFKTTYENKFVTMLFMGTNKPVKITEAKSGLLRRLIDVKPTGKKVSVTEYRQLMKQIKFELGAIAYKCLKCYEKDPGRYDDYIPLEMLGASNDFYNFVLDTYYTFEKQDGVTLKAAYELYKQYCSDANTLYPLSKMKFKEEFKNYFWKYFDRFTDQNGVRVRNYYSGFRIDKFENKMVNIKDYSHKTKELINFRKRKSVFDEYCKDCPAQYANKDDAPKRKWADVKSKLSDIDTSRVHYVKIPQNHIVIDFDLVDENGEKSLEKNIEAASEWPKTYAELSKSGKGVHLHYIYDGDVDKLARIYKEHIEIKVFKGKSSLRRKLSKCNNEEIATISSGLPYREEKKVLTKKSIASEKGLRRLIEKNLNKEIHANTSQSINFIHDLLEEAYNNETLHYDVSDMRNAVLTFAMHSTNQAQRCVDKVNKMKFKSKESSEGILIQEDPIKIKFFDLEVWPNVWMICWKYEGENEKVIKMINPTAAEVEEFLISTGLVGFNCRRYDNHILYAAMMGYTVEELYRLSQRIIDGDRNAFFMEGYGKSYLDAYDVASTKQSLKKWEIELGIHHKEMGYPWDEPLPEDKWEEAADYCANDVIATEAVYHHLMQDINARRILSKMVCMPMNATTNSLTTRKVFGQNKHPQEYFNYRNLAEGKMSKCLDSTVFVGDEGLDYQKLVKFDEYTAFDDETGMAFFPGYKFENKISTYRGEEIGEGGYVYAEPGIYQNVKTFDVASMHPTSIIQENLFGEEYTRNFKDLLDTRLAIKHGDLKKAKEILGADADEYLKNKEQASDLSYALKIAINSVYGLTAAKFDNPFRDIRNVDNIVAKRGALFMVNLKHEVQKLGYKVIHIKTDSIKIENPDDFIEWFVINYGKLYGYNFEIESEYEKLCLVNDAVYVGKTKEGKWEAVGTQFAVPYVFKTLFSKEPITFDDMCETKSVSTAIYLDYNENLPDVTEEEKKKKELESKYKKGEINDTTFEKECKPLVEKIAKGHKMVFVGKVGQFTPVQNGKGGGLLMRLNKTNDRFDSVNGTKGYRWMESELLRESKSEKDVDESYYKRLVDEAVDTINKFGDAEAFLD